MSAQDCPFSARAASYAAFLLASQLGCSPRYELLRSVDAGGSDSGGSEAGGFTTGGGGFAAGGTGFAGGDAGGALASGGYDVGVGGTGIGTGGIGGIGGTDGIGGTSMAIAGGGGRGSECTSNDECPNNGICCECADTSRVCLSTTGGAPIASCPQACAPP